ncbi:DUF6634 family protein [Shimia aestuarii]|uniref:DUF6634 family protein n=1 Tax=Shimia aestuarii TaxID=254406 RepID=UPI0032608EDA
MPQARPQPGHLLQIQVEVWGHVTSQLVAIDANIGWARTASRWYVLSQPFSDYEAKIAKSLGMEKASSGFVQTDVPGYRPLDDLSLLDELLGAWRERMMRNDTGEG